MCEDCEIEIFEEFLKTFIKMNDNGFVKMAIDYYRNSGEQFLYEDLCSEIVCSGDDELFNYITNDLSKLNLDTILTNLINKIMMTGKHNLEERVGIITQMGGDINDIGIVNSAILANLDFLKKYGFTDHLKKDIYIRALNEIDSAKELIKAIHSLVEDGIDLNYIEEKLGLK